jgi:hypothetical protein
MDRQCSSCGGFCKKSGCERENVKLEPEPVAWAWTVNSGAGYYTKGVGFDKTDIPFAKHTPLYTAPPQREQRAYIARKWQGLTDEDCEEVERWIGFKEEGSGRIPTRKLILYIETKLKEKNSG